jgi:hypothetical protein
MRAVFVAPASRRLFAFASKDAGKMPALQSQFANCLSREPNKPRQISSSFQSIDCSLQSESSAVRLLEARSGGLQF